MVALANRTMFMSSTWRTTYARRKSPNRYDLADRARNGHALVDESRAAVDRRRHARHRHRHPQGVALRVLDLPDDGQGGIREHEPAVSAGKPGPRLCSRSIRLS